MNRRQFFGMTAAAVAAAGLPALVLPDRSIFLPPRMGWLAKRSAAIILPAALEAGLVVTVVNHGTTELIIHGDYVVKRPSSSHLKEEGEMRTFICVPDEPTGLRWVSMA